MAQIDINFNGSDDGPGNTSQMLVDVLNKLNNAIDKLNLESSRKKSTSEKNETTQDTNTRTIDNFNKASEKAFSDLGSKIGTIIGAAATVSIARYFNNQASSIMGRATATGNFVAQAIGGNANQAFGGYINNLFDIERQRQIGNNNIVAEGVGGGIGSTISSVGKFLAGNKGSAFTQVGGQGLDYAGMLVGAVGASGGKLAVSEFQNQRIEMQMLRDAARARLRADSSISQWQTGFSRFGLDMTNTQIAGSNITHGAPISTPLQTEFMNKYGNSQNFKAIQEQIVPYLQKSPLDSSNGNLDVVAQQFLKAGFAVSDFGKLTMQSSQYQAVTGKNFKEFGTDIAQARAKFGDAFDISTNQTALNLMSAGYQKDQAQHLAFQSQFNPGMANSISQWSNQGYSEFYRNKFLSSSVGFDINASLQSGQITGATTKTVNEIKQELADYQSNKTIGPKMSLLMNTGVANYSSLRSLVQNQVPENELSNQQKDALKSPGMSPGQANADYQSKTIDKLLSNVQSMTVNAANVTVINGHNGGISNATKNIGGFLMPGMTPSPLSALYSPAK